MTAKLQWEEQFEKYSRKMNFAQTKLTLFSDHLSRFAQSHSQKLNEIHKVPIQHSRLQ
jgi:hypothetical protein